MRMGAPLQLDAYRGVRCLQPLSAIKTARDVEVHFSLGSSNDLALQCLAEGLQRPRVISAEYQFAGRGRMARRWEQGLGCGLNFSLAVPACMHIKRDALPLRIAVALAAALRSVGVRDIRIKWPNDLLWREQKLAGILIESSPSGVVIGVGVNYLRARREHLGATVSLQDMLGARLPGRDHLLRRLLQHMHQVVQSRDEDWQMYFAQWDALRERTVHVREATGAIWQGLAQGIDRNGALRVKVADGERLCHSAEVSVRTERWVDQS